MSINLVSFLACTNFESPAYIMSRTQQDMVQVGMRMQCIQSHTGEKEHKEILQTIDITFILVLKHQYNTQKMMAVSYMFQVVIWPPLADYKCLLE